MTAHNWFSLLSIVSNLGFILLLVSAMITAGGTRTAASLRRFTMALRLAWTAFGFATVALIANLADVPTDGFLWPALSVLSCVSAAITAAGIRRRRELKGEQVLRDAERVVSDFTWPYAPDKGTR